MKQMWSKEEIEKITKNTPKRIETLVDSAGNPRFVEGNGTPATIEGFTPTYCKWSLSGTHLMLVLSGKLDNGTIIDGTSSVTLAEFTLPNYIYDKVIPVFATYQVDRKTVYAYASNWTSQSFGANLSKDGGKITIIYPQGSSFTLNADRNFRAQFDLLIDAE